MKKSLAIWKYALMKWPMAMRKPSNPVAKAVAINRRRTSVVPDRTKYNRKKDKEKYNAEVKNSDSEKS